MISIERKKLEQVLATLVAKDTYGSSIREAKETAITVIKEALAQPEQEPVAIPDDVRKAAQAMQKNGYRGPFGWASMVINFVADYAAPPKLLSLTDDQKDAARYRWLFNDVDLTAIKTAFDGQKAPPTNMHSQVIEQIIGFYSDKQSVDAMIDAATKAAHGIKEDA